MAINDLTINDDTHTISKFSAFIGLGSNLNNPQQQISTALTHLKNLPNTLLMKWSHCYSSKALSTQDKPCDYFKGLQPDFINACAQLLSHLSPYELLTELQRIESQLGKKNTQDPLYQKWAPRIIDLDILHIEGVTLKTPELKLPHPEMFNRAFVLIPLLEIAPKLYLPNFLPDSKNTSIQAYADRLSSVDCANLKKCDKPIL